MAKKKQNKGSKEILYRLVMAVMAACVPVAAYFCDYIYMVLESDIFKLLAQLKGDTEDTGATSSAWSVNRFVEEIVPMLKENASGGESLMNILEPIKPAMICVAVFFALAVVLAVVIFFFSVFSKKKTVPMCIAFAGILSMIALRISFHYVATPFLDGTLPLSAFFSSSIITSILAGLSSFSVIRLTTGYFVMLFLFVAMALWAGANKLIELGDKPQKAAK